MNIIKNRIPISVRKKVKNNFLKYFSCKITENIIPDDVIASWSIEDNKSFDILNFSIISWDFRFQRPQQLASAFAKMGYRVFYVENSFLPDKAAKSIFSAEKIEQNLFKIKLSSPYDYFIYSDLISENDVLHIVDCVKELLINANIKRAIAKIDHPFWYQICKKIDIPIVYDCMDNHFAFQETNRKLFKVEQELIKRANLVITSSEPLLKKVKIGNNNSFLISNGVDYHYFSQNKLIAVPNDMLNIKHPIIGYYGAIDRWLDINNIEKLLKNRPNYNLVLIGKIENSSILRLKKFKNLYLLGEKNYNEIKAYLDQFDLCLIPFKINQLIKSTDPIKLYEFFAAGKRVVSSKIPSILKYKEQIYFYNDNNIVHIIDNALKIKQNNIIDKRIIAYSKNWNNLAKEYVYYLEKIKQ